MNMVSQPMFAQGFAGLHRRMVDGGATYSMAQNADSGLKIIGDLAPGIIKMNGHIFWAAIGLFLFQIPFIVNFFCSMFKGQKVTSDNPWQATTLDWQTPTPPPHGNFTVTPTVHRGPYEYSVPGAKTDFSPQSQAD